MNKEPKFVDVHGAQVMDLTPDYERPLALVDLDVLGKLTSLLKTADLFSIKRALKHLIDEASTIEDYVEVLDAEVAFHKTVNLIKEVTKSELAAVTVVGKIDLEDDNNY